MIVSLASAEFSSAIEPFLRSLCTLERPVAVTKHLALLSAVACASANDQKSLQQVLQLGGISAEEFDSNYQKIAGSYFR